MKYSPYFIKKQHAYAYEAEPGAVFTELIRQKDGARTMVTGLVTFEPGSSLPCHNHNVEEIITVISGEGICLVEGQGEPIPVKPYDASFIPPGVAHRFINTSETNKMVIHYAYGLVDENLSPVEGVERNLIDEASCNK